MRTLTVTECRTTGTSARYPAGSESIRQWLSARFDKDGVPDYRDSCPDTPEAVAVDTTGCDSEYTPRSRNGQRLIRTVTAFLMSGIPARTRLPV